MSSISKPSYLFHPESLGGAVKVIAGFALFWAFASVLLFFAAPGLDSFGRILIFQECSGTAIVVIALLVRRSRWLTKGSQLPQWLLIGFIAIPSGYVLGHIVAFLMFGEAIRFISPGPDRMVPIVFTLLVTGFMLYFFATREQLASEAAQRSEAQRLAVESQLRMLRTQLEPHMLFNTLANLRSLVGDDPRQAEVMIDRLIVYLRSALAASRTESTTLSREFSQLRAYLDIMSVRMGTRLTYQIDMPAELDQTKIPPMLLQPLLENAIRHGIEPKVGSGSIEVVARRTQDSVEISVLDTGIGLPPDDEVNLSTDATGGSYGLLHVRERLAVIYGSRASLTLTRREPSGVCAVVSIPA